MLGLEIRSIFKNICKDILFDAHIKNQTTLKIGGVVDALAFPQNVRELLSLLRITKKLRIKTRVVGNCSNLVFPDGTLHLFVISTSKLRGIEINAKLGRMTVMAGETTGSCFGEAVKYGLSGFEKIAGIPGTIGAGIRGNSGCFGAEMSDILRMVKVITSDGKIKEFSPIELDFGYRSSLLQKSGDIVVSAEFQLQRLAPRTMIGVLKECAAKRKLSQPDLPSAGCVFKKYGDISAGMLIDQLGLKGLRIGGCEISPIHANFIVNTGDGRADDFKALVEIARTKVKSQFGIILEREVEYI